MLKINLTNYYWYFKSAIPERSCDDISKYGKQLQEQMAVTGGLGNTLKNANKDNILNTGTIIEGSDSIIMKVSFSRKFSFLARSKEVLKKINRQSLPSELALKRGSLHIKKFLPHVLIDTKNKDLDSLTDDDFKNNKNNCTKSDE